MLSQLLSQLGVETDLGKVTGEDVAAMVGKAETAKAQVQNATTYARAVKSMLRSTVKLAKVRADLYETAHEQLKEMDGHRLTALKSELDHDIHMHQVKAKADGARQVAGARSVSVVQVEQAKTQQRIIAIAAKHRKAIAAAQPKRQGLLRMFR